MKPPAIGTKDLVYYGFFFLGAIAGYVLLGMLGVTDRLPRSLGSMAIGWALGFVADRLSEKDEKKKE